MSLFPPSSHDLHDIAIIGGGINGAGIARDAAGRGLSVILFEQADLASATSSASTKLIHGGLRYLEHFAFRLVRESLIERERLLRIAPHIIWPLRFVLPHEAGMRPAWLLRLGLFLYDHLGGRELLPATRTLSLARDSAGQGLAPHLRYAFEYSDCWADDARLVILNARDAAKRGATILPRWRVVSARQSRNGEAPFWILTALSRTSGETREFAAKILVNAGGPWAGTVVSSVMGRPVPAPIRLVQGSHIVVRRLFAHDRAYMFQNKDGRIVFAIPYEQDFTLIGTTDRDYAGDPAKVAASAEEIAYLCHAASSHLARPITPQDVVWNYAGVRPLYDDGASSAQDATRDYVLNLDEPAGDAAALSVFGGKLTTYRRLAEHALEKLDPHLPERARNHPRWTMNGPLPGGDFPHDGFDDLKVDLGRMAPFLAEKTRHRLARLYGSDAFSMLHGAKSAVDLGRDFGAGLTEREIAFLKENEWAMSAEDILWRRTKLHLHMSEAERQAVQVALGG